MQSVLNIADLRQNDRSKSNGCQWKTTRLWWTSSWRRMLPDCSKFQSQNVHIWIPLPRHFWPKSLSDIEDPVVVLERNLYDTHLQVSCGKDSSRKSCWNLDGKKSRIECQGLFLSAYVDGIKMAGKKQNTAPMWKKLMNKVDVGEPTSSLDHVFILAHHVWFAIVMVSTFSTSEIITELVISKKKTSGPQMITRVTGLHVSFLTSLSLSFSFFLSCPEWCSKDHDRLSVVHRSKL